MFKWLLSLLDRKEERFEGGLVKQEGVLKDLVDERDHNYVGGFLELVFETPERYQVPLPKWLEVKNQGVLNSCGSHALTTCMEIQFGSEGRRFHLSELFHYYTARKLKGNQDKNVGMYLRDACKAGREFGVGLERYWPYSFLNYRVNPPFPAYFSGGLLRLKGYERVHSTSDMKYRLWKDGMPLVLGLEVTDKFVEGGGVIRLGGKVLFGHAVCCFGFDEGLGAFRVLNSWGKNWCQGGFAWVSYDYVMKHFIDCWTVNL